MIPSFCRISAISAVSAPCGMLTITVVVLLSMPSISLPYTMITADAQIEISKTTSTITKVNKPRCFLRRFFFLPVGSSGMLLTWLSPSKSRSNLERIAFACIRLVASGAVKGGAVCSIVRSARTAAGCLPASGLGGAFRRCANTYSMSESIRESPAGGLELGCLGTAAVRLAAEWAPEAAGRTAAGIPCRD